MEGVIALLDPHLSQPPPTSREQQAGMPDRHACRFSQVAPKALQGLRALVKRSLSSFACSHLSFFSCVLSPRGLALLVLPLLPSLPAPARPCPSASLHGCLALAHGRELCSCVCRVGGSVPTGAERTQRRKARLGAGPSASRLACVWRRTCCGNNARARGVCGVTCFALPGGRYQGTNVFLITEASSKKQEQVVPPSSPQPPPHPLAWSIQRVGSADAIAGPQCADTVCADAVCADTGHALLWRPSLI